ncbi:MAG: DUF167 domain-containing protein [Thermodesulfobacteriota bacterium]|nr:DUF167 domain-containing protein [Thermodesulfobacteriota bacterium]
MALPEYVTKAGPGVWNLRVWVQPRAKRDAMAGVHQGRLKIRIKAPAVDNKANKALIIFVSGLLGLKPRRVQLISGQKSRLKSLQVESGSEPIWPDAARCE